MNPISAVAKGVVAVARILWGLIPTGKAESAREQRSRIRAREQDQKAAQAAGKGIGPAGTAALILGALAASCAAVDRARYSADDSGLDVLADVRICGPAQVGVVAEPSVVTVCVSLPNGEGACVEAEPLPSPAR